MSKHASNFCTNRTGDHGLHFEIEGATVTVDDMANSIVTIMGGFISESDMEEFVHDATHAIIEGVVGKVKDVKQRESRAAWEHRHPPNHAGFYYCHICGGWVHRDQAELDHIIPTSVITLGVDPDRDDNRRMAHKWPQYDTNGKEVCMGNQKKGSQLVPSKTMEIAPPDGEC